MGKEKYLLIFILVLGLVLRLIKINQSFWLDEASQSILSSQSISQIWHARSADFQPPLFYILSHYWLLISHSESWARLLPIFFGLLNILVVYLFAKRINPKIALISALFLSINSFHVYYSQEFRMYSLLCLLGTASMFAFYKKHWSLCIFNALLLYTHYSSVFLIISQFVYVLLFNRKYLKNLVFYFLTSLTFYLPWIPQFQKQLSSGVNIDNYLPGWRNILSLSPIKALPLILFKFVAGRINLFPKSIYATYIAFVLIITGFGIGMARGKRRLLYTWTFVPIIGSILLSFVVPQTQPFRLIFILPALMILFAETTLRFPKFFFAIIIYISLVGNFVYFTRPRLQREQWRQALSFIRSRPAPMLVKFPGPFAPITWYAGDLETVAVVPTMPAKQKEVSLILNSQLKNKNNIYLFNYLSDLSDPALVVEQELKLSGYTFGKVYNFEGVGFVTEYHRQIK